MEEKRITIKELVNHIMNKERMIEIRCGGYYWRYLEFFGTIKDIPSEDLNLKVCWHSWDEVPEVDGKNVLYILANRS